jgi:hypothetical protein
MNVDKTFLREISIGLGIGLLTNFIWATVADQLNPYLVIAIFIFSFLAYLLLWFYVIKPVLIVRKLKIKATYFQYEKAKSEIKQKMSTSSSIKIITIGGGSIAEDERGGMLDILYKRTKAEETQIKILISNPISSGLEERHKELEKLHPGKFDAPSLKKSILTNVQKITSRSKVIEVRLYDSKPVWRMFILDELAFISSYLSDKEGHESEMVVFEKGTDMFRAFERVFDIMWQASCMPEDG